MESKYKELIAALRQLAAYDKAAADEAVGDPMFAAALIDAADAIDTLSMGINVYAKENEALIAWRHNAEGWLSKVAEEKAAAYHRNSAVEAAAAMYAASKNIEPAPVWRATRESVLHDAEKCVCGQREQDYGTPEDNFAKIAQLWTAYSGYPFDGVDVAMMMALLKIARISNGGGTEDSFVDLAGYAACGGEIWAKAKAESVSLSA